MPSQIQSQKPFDPSVCGQHEISDRETERQCFAKDKMTIPLPGGDSYTVDFEFVYYAKEAFIYEPIDNPKDFFITRPANYWTNLILPSK